MMTQTKKQKRIGKVYILCFFLLFFITFLCHADDAKLFEAPKLSPKEIAEIDAKISQLKAEAEKASLADMKGTKLVNVLSYIPDVALDIRYATKNNFVGEPFYELPVCALREPVAKKLARVQDLLKKQGFGLIIYDCYRPLYAQWILWRKFPKPGFVADPRIGSNHNRGAAVDIGLFYLDSLRRIDTFGAFTGAIFLFHPLIMPSEYDEMGPRAQHSWKGGDKEALKNREILKKAMLLEGFKINKSEWWHYDDVNCMSYPVENISLSALSTE